MANWLTHLQTFSEEAADRCSVAKVDFLTGVGRTMLPAGFWGGHCEGAESDGTGAGSTNGDHKGQSAREGNGSGCASARKADAPIYLTFDDGPDPVTTPLLLDLLAANDVKAMFFLIGEKVKEHPELVSRIKDAGHTVGNHTYSHPLLLTLPTSTVELEIDRTNAAIKEITGEQPIFFRAPYGLMDQRAGVCLKERGMKVVYWGSAPEDWSAPGIHRVVRRVLWKLAPGTVVVLHEGYGLGEQTVAAAKQIICTAHERGLRMAQVK